MTSTGKNSPSFWGGKPVSPYLLQPICKDRRFQVNMTVRSNWRLWKVSVDYQQFTAEHDLDFCTQAVTGRCPTQTTGWMLACLTICRIGEDDGCVQSEIWMEVWKEFVLDRVSRCEKKITFMFSVGCCKCTGDQKESSVAVSIVVVRNDEWWMVLNAMQQVKEILSGTAVRDEVLYLFLLLSNHHSVQRQSIDKPEDGPGTLCSRSSTFQLGGAACK